MSIKDYIIQKFQSFGISMSEADLLDIALTSGLDGESEMSGKNHNKVSVAIAKFIPSLYLRATSVSENGFSMSWDLTGLKAYYSYMCKQYGLKDEINTDKPKVKFL